MTEGKKELVFEPERDAKGKFLARPNEGLRYVNKETGQVMTEGQLGQVSTFRWWWLIQNLFVNLLHFVVWCVCLWLLLKFQFWHAFGMAVVAWLAMTLFVLPPLLDQAENTGKQPELFTAEYAEDRRGKRKSKVVTVSRLNLILVLNSAFLRVLCGE